MNPALNGWLLVHGPLRAFVVVFVLAPEDTLFAAPTATAPTIVKATNTPNNFFILLMTSVSSRDDRRPAASHLLRCADRVDPGHRLISKDANFTNACTGSFGPNRPKTTGSFEAYSDDGLEPEIVFEPMTRVSQGGPKGSLASHLIQGVA